jgi:hypothetical protein
MNHTRFNLSLICELRYFNHFNEVIMLFGMLPDMPDMLDEIDAWSLKNYCEHFANSNLAFAPLAIELYPLVSETLRTSLEKLIDQMEMMIIETRAALRQAYEAGETAKVLELAALGSLQLQGMVEAGGAIVHGHDAMLDQEAINKLF